MPISIFRSRIGVAGFAILLAGIVWILWYASRGSLLIPPADSGLQRVYRGVGHGPMSPKPDPDVPGKIVREGQAFYPDPVEVDSAVKDILNVLKDRSAYESYQAKKCGDFHADFEADWSGPPHETRVQVCLTCGDARCFRGDSSKMYSLSAEAFQRLKSAWSGITFVE